MPHTGKPEGKTHPRLAWARALHENDICSHEELTAFENGGGSRQATRDLLIARAWHRAGQRSRRAHEFDALLSDHRKQSGQQEDFIQRRLAYVIEHVAGVLNFEADDASGLDVNEVMSKHAHLTNNVIEPPLLPRIDDQEWEQQAVAGWLGAVEQARKDSKEKLLQLGIRKRHNGLTCRLMSVRIRLEMPLVSFLRDEQQGGANVRQAEKSTGGRHGRRDEERRTEPPAVRVIGEGDPVTGRGPIGNCVDVAPAGLGHTHNRLERQSKEDW